jgi:hypothetical protein
MTKEEKNILEAFLLKTLNLSGEAISGLFNAEGELTDLSTAIEADANRVAKFKAEKQNEFNKGLEKGASKIEKAIKEKYQVDSDLIGVELLDHVIEAQTAEIQEKLKSKSKDDDFEKHPKYIEFKKNFESQLKAKEQEWEGKLQERESEWVRKETLNKVTKLAFNSLENEYLLPENKDRASALKDVLNREIESGNYKIDESGEVVLLDKDGKPLEDKHGKFIAFKEYVDSIAGKYFDKKVANPRGNSGNQNQPGNQPTGAFKTKEEFQEAMFNAKTNEEKAAVYVKYKDSNIN